MRHKVQSAAVRLALAVAFAALLTPILALEASTVTVTTASGASVAWNNSYVVAQHALPDNGSQPWEIAAGPAGSIWFVEQGTNMLGEYLPSNDTFLQFRIPTNGSTPDGVAVDSGGNVWLAELTSSKLGELPGGRGAVREFKIPGLPVGLGSSSQSLDCGPGAVVPDQYGDVWIACLFSNQIDRFYPSSGAFAVYDLPVFQSAPAGLLLDGKGDLWFTAADADMLGKAVISQLVNGTADGITEFPPVNQTYIFRPQHLTAFAGSTEVITSSLPTPSGIAMDGAGRIWVTEHVDSSFDSYDPATKSFVRYWTSQTDGAYGFSVSFPNGIAVDSGENVWVGEHYGNKILRFSPSSGVMTEVPVPCCASDIAGVYSVALDSHGNLWFVEINGNAIGEVTSRGSPGLALNFPENSLAFGPYGNVTIPLVYSLARSAPNSTQLQLSVSGTSYTGALQNMSDSFTQAKLQLLPGRSASTALVLKADGISPGIYYLTLGATAQDGETYSTVLKVTVAEGAFLPSGDLLPIALAISGAAALGGWAVARHFSRPRRKTWRRGPRALLRRSSLLSSSRMAAAAIATPE